MALLDRAINHFGVSEEVEAVVKESALGQGLDEFLAAMQRLYEAKQFFEENKPDSVELESVVRKSYTR